MNDFLKFIQRILSSNNERVILQRFYLCLAFFGFAVASFLNIFENSISRTILLITVSSLIVFLINAIVWTLGEALKNNFLLKSNKRTKDSSKSVKNK
ncbi:MAG: hypothetical protein HXK93_01805 [Candidatus Nanogingivalaceae bacterium]|jgi:hypothetical protein|nr:hypothetical protein [Candidatus Nanogingivalaceae bacterium]